ncbi:hypothetical protein E6P09_08205 [Haloferax mediterranei ATCC 33500]|uniref:TIGR04206 family protein n=1 Tax=Haloferax mediterranei (strain ATCC 33500 / DSM 1411 / JCM 8866 / NBRC 14739 / NCIMB 2177 / R-4) TaxID=523841 RepID=I3R3D9_HALMT|nr:hypothetical protein [Haloferax mediterranei]AFK18749.1 hypothetical protein HFX_1033 [Haloferax mediterranei ATCC 33500]AHZ21883.1 hypothetical protein BM92_04050 [Haloferax mediterranei ATCC 33500]EMA03391.1 hypothetical protein C439_05315 [Haloferax mediterranei ATCC 33500]MDX5988845.1 hypothetical protein [Haloferax mediterranei ATCC 33500]QCQ75246.1 hypothetical protein E6P09_08205 [Haloferax mediterranei ATCC 33500]
MVWVRSEHAGALAVISTWLCALLPWNITYTANIAGVSLLYVRFPFAEIQYAWGLSQRVAVRDPLSAMALQSGQSVATAYQAWVVGAALMAVAVLFSVVYYLREERVEAGPVDPVRLAGGLLGLTGVVLAVATYLLATRGIPGIPLPLGVIISLVFGGVLLTVDRT